MNCPNCGADKTYVTDSRISQKHRHRVNKRRDCYDCDKKFYTYDVLREEADQAFAVRELLSNLIKGVRHES